MKQATSVVLFTKSVLGTSFQTGDAVKSYITDAQIEEITDAVTASIANGETDLSDAARTKYSDAKALRRYVKGMVGNWFNKSKELNGDVKYEAKNPGSRAGSGDKAVAETKKLMATLDPESDGYARCQEFIDNRLAEISKSKPTKQVNAELIPDELKQYLSA